MVARLLQPVQRTARRAGWVESDANKILVVSVATGEITPEAASPVKQVVVRDGVVQRGRDGNIRRTYHREGQRQLSRATQAARELFLSEQVQPRLDELAAEGSLEPTAALIAAAGDADAARNLAIEVAEAQQQPVAQAAN